MATGDTALMDVGGAPEAPVVETPEIQAPDTETAPVETVAEQAPTDQQPQSFDPSGKATPQALKNAFAKLSEGGDKKLADHIRGQYFENQSIRQMFPGGLNEIRNLRETFEVLGGEQGVQELQADAKEFAEVLKGISTGDPQVVDQVFEDSVEGGKKLSVAAFDKLRSVDPQLHSNLAMSAFSDILKQSGFPDGINTLAAGLDGLLEDIARPDGQKDAYRTVQNLRAWFEKFKAMGTRQTQNQPDEKSQQLAQREHEVATEKENLYRTNFNSNLNKQIVIPAFQKEMTAFLKGRTLTTEQKQTFESQFYSRLAKEFAEEGFTRKRDMLLQRHDDKALTNLYKPRVSELAPKIFKQVRDSLGYSVGTSAKLGAQAPTGPTFGKKPDASEINWNLDRSRARFQGRKDAQGRLIGEATLKNGKVVKWDWNAVNL